jgi:hypothetical protein
MYFFTMKRFKFYLFIKNVIVNSNSFLNVSKLNCLKNHCGEVKLCSFFFQQKSFMDN